MSPLLLTPISFTYVTQRPAPMAEGSKMRSRVHSLWLLVDHCVLRNLGSNHGQGSKGITWIKTNNDQICLLVGLGEWFWATPTWSNFDLVIYSCELGQIMTRYDFLEARSVIWSNVWTDFWHIFCSQKVNYKWRRYTGLLLKKQYFDLFVVENLRLYPLYPPPPPPHTHTHDHRWMTIWRVF